MRLGTGVQDPQVERYTHVPIRGLNEKAADRHGELQGPRAESQPIRRRREEEGQEAELHGRGGW